MNTLTVSFFRHGETKSNIEGRCAGRTDILITENGRRKLKELRHIMRILWISQNRQLFVRSIWKNMILEVSVMN